MNTNNASNNKLGDLLGRFYFVVPLGILASLPAVELIIKGSLELTLPNILIIIASSMCLVTWTMRIRSELINLMPVIITAIACLALAMLMISKTPDLNLHATAAMMIMMIWLTSAPRINIIVQSVVSLLIILGVSYILSTAHLSIQNLITVSALLLSGVMMGAFTQVHQHIHAQDNVPGDMLTADLSNMIYDEDAEDLFKESHQAELDQDWPQVLEKLSKNLNSIHDVDIVFSKMLLILQDAIPYKSAAIGLLQGRDLTVKQSHGDESILTPEVLNWSNELIRTVADKRHEITSRFVYEAANGNKQNYYRLDLPVISNDKLIGIVTLIRDTDEFNTYSCKLSSSIIFHSMVSLRNARLYEEFKKLNIKGKQATLISRSQFMQSSAKNIGRLNQPRNASLMLVEIDHFEKLEERYNKEVSLSVYNAISDLLLKTTRDDDLVGHYEKESYIILLNDTDLLDAKKLAERMRQLISKTPCKTAVGKITTTVSIGLVSATDADEELSSLVQRAGMALYVAKESGKNVVKVKL